MTENNREKTEDQGIHHTKRDAETQMVLGIFITYISIPVLLGTFWAVRSHAMIVNVVAGFVLFGIGVGMWAWGRKVLKKLKEGEEG